MRARASRAAASPACVGALVLLLPARVRLCELVEELGGLLLERRGEEARAEPLDELDGLCAKLS